MNVAWRNYDLCANSDVYDYLSSPESPLIMTRGNPAIDGIITKKRLLAKEVIRKAILVNLKHRIPEIVSACLSYRRLLFHQFVRGIEYDVNQVIESAPLNAVGVMTSEGTILNVLVFLNAYPMFSPRVFTSFGVPDTFFQAGIALTGDLCIDTSKWNQIYINKGTDINYPRWVAEYTAKDALDNLLNVGFGRIDKTEVKVANGGTGYAVNDLGTINGGTYDAQYQVTSVSGGVVTGLSMLSTGAGYLLATGATTTQTSGSGSGLTININGILENELMQAAVYQTVIQMMQDGAWRNRVGFESSEAIAANSYQSNRMNKLYQDALRPAMALLEVDIDGDGIIHDAERRLMDTSLAVIG